MKSFQSYLEGLTKPERKAVKEKRWLKPEERKINTKDIYIPKFISKNLVINPTIEYVKIIEKLDHFWPRGIILDHDGSVDLYVSKNKMDVHSDIQNQLSEIFGIWGKMNYWWRKVDTSDFMLCVHYYENQWLLSESYNKELITSEEFKSNINKLENAIKNKIDGFKIIREAVEYPE